MPIGKKLGKISGKQSCERQLKNGHDQDRENENRRVPMPPDPPSAHPGEKIPKATSPIYNTRQGDTRKAGPGQHRQEHEQGIRELHGLTPDEL